ncbi:MAG TPA: RsmE family RNA methyltransferase [Gemmatimonadaceae bacterium]|nr:RsmE family RNA methyltransferase [Gemmatimonadaceae bacterium]
MVERHDRATLATFYSEAPLTTGELRVEGTAAQHARVLRLASGSAVRLADGRGRVGGGELLSIGKSAMSVRVDHVAEVPRPTTLEAIVPVADRDRMLIAAEKCVELQVTAWRPAICARSRSVVPRGEGAKFRDKVAARMRGALEQSGSAWLPDTYEELDLGEALAAVPEAARRLLLDSTGEPLAGLVWNGPTAFAVGPEGGFEDAEVKAALQAGWMTASLGTTTLRFETAVIASAAVLRAAQLSTRSE